MKRSVHITLSWGSEQKSLVESVSQADRSVHRASQEGRDDTIVCHITFADGGASGGQSDADNPVNRTEVARDFKEHKRGVFPVSDGEVLFRRYRDFGHANLPLVKSAA